MASTITTSTIRVAVPTARVAARRWPACPPARVGGTAAFASKPAVFQRRSTITASIKKEVVSTDDAPAALGPYSQAIKAGGMLYGSGSIGLKADGSMEFAGETVEEQCEQVMANIGAILKAGGSSYASVVKTTILLSDMGDFATVNGIYGRFFPEAPPARATFAVKTLPLNCKVEIDFIAIVEN